MSLSMLKARWWEEDGKRVVGGYSRGFGAWTVAC